MSVEKHRFLIVGGAPKAGTTSVFKYLADHPDVCASSLKETRFFLDIDYPLPRARLFDGTNLEEYAGFFKHCPDNDSLLKVEATPDYLYSNTAIHIAELLPHAKIVFILRDPVERMVSWYKYACQRGLIEEEKTFEDYVMAQVDRPVTADTPPHLRALEQCRYEKYLRAFREAFGERCMVVDFGDLKADPRGLMSKLCAFAALAESFYDTYTFRAENVSHAVRSAWIMRGYNSIRRSLSHALHNHPAATELLRKPNRIIKKALSINAKEAEREQVSDEIVALIRREMQEKTIAELANSTAAYSESRVMP